MKILIAGSSGLIGGEAVEYFGSREHQIVGIDGRLRMQKFGPEADNQWNLHRVAHKAPFYTHHSLDLREPSHLRFHVFENQVPFDVIIDCAGEPEGTKNLIAIAEKYSPNALFIYMSRLGYNSTELDVTYSALKSVVLRLGNVSGPGEAGVPEDGKLSYILKCAINNRKCDFPAGVEAEVSTYISSYDVISAVEEIINNPKNKETYELTGTRDDIIDTVLLVDKFEVKMSKKIDYKIATKFDYDRVNVSFSDRFQKHYPNWKRTKNLGTIMDEMIQHAYWGRYSDHEDTKTYDLNESSVVVDIGGYRGAFTDDISKKYNPYIFLFEPVKEFYDACVTRFRYNLKVLSHNFGLSDKDEFFTLSKQGQNTSAFRGGPGQPTLVADAVYGEPIPEVCFLKDAAGVFEQNRWPEFDLVSINAEGGEFKIIPRLIESGQINRIKNLQVQFHRFVPGADTLRNEIRSKLSGTHREKFCYPWVWESWTRK
jgi:FkbM family methyltransferase